VIRTKRGVQWGRGQIRVSQKGVGPQRKQKGLKVKDTIVIRIKREMQWTRLQIRVLTGPKLFFFYSCRVILHPEYFCSGRIKKFSIIKMSAGSVSAMKKIDRGQFVVQ
jgi:hypothetical protein